MQACFPPKTQGKEERGSEDWAASMDMTGNSEGRGQQVLHQGLGTSGLGWAAWSWPSSSAKRRDLDGQDQGLQTHSDPALGLGLGGYTMPRPWSEQDGQG